MSNTIKILRAFNTDDANLIQFSRTTKINLENNLAAFTAFDADFDAAFITAYETAINNAEGFNSDNQLIDVQVQATLDLEEKMKECRDYYQNMKYFIEKAFPGKPGTWAEFGYNDYERVRNRSTSFIQFMHDLFEVSTKYEAIMVAAGFDAPRIAAIKTLTDELRAAKSLQEQSKGTRSTAANDRIILLNDLWEITHRICMAGKAVFYQDYGRYQLFLLPWNSGSSSAEEEVSYDGIIHSQETLNIAIPNLQPDTVLVISNTGTEPLTFCGSNVSAMACPGGFIVNPSDSQSVTFASISNDPATAVFLNVSHTIAPPSSPDGSYEVTITT